MIKQRSFATYILLSIVTCGIYSIVFWYQWTEDMNRLCAGDGKDSPNFIVVWLLSIITCGIYLWVWYYQMANRMQANAPRYGIALQENGTTILLWKLLGALLCGIGTYYGDYLLIKNTNTLADLYNAQFAPQYPDQQPPMQQPPVQ